MKGASFCAVLREERQFPIAHLLTSEVINFVTSEKGHLNRDNFPKNGSFWMIFFLQCGSNFNPGALVALSEVCCVWNTPVY